MEKLDLTLGQFIKEELNLKDKKSIVQFIYKFILKNAPSICHDDGIFQCHTTNEYVKKNKTLQKYWWHKQIKYYNWNEYHWEAVAKKLKKDNRKFNNRVIDWLISDISEGAVNGHSFMSFQGYFIDPFLKSSGVNEQNIQKFDKYFLTIM